MANGQNPFGGQNPFRSSGAQRTDDNVERFDSNGRKVKKGGGKVPKALIGVIVAVLVALLLASNCYYVLDEDNYAVVTTLGKGEAVSQAGLHFKIPFVQIVR